MSAKEKATIAPNMGEMQLGGTVAPLNTIIANSEVIQIGDFVMHDVDGFIVRATTGNAVAGVVTSVSQDGIGIDADAGTQDTFTVASDNETNLKKYAIINVSPHAIYSVDSDATPGTTTGSDLPGYYANLADETQIDESTASATTGTLVLFGTDPDDSTRILAKINESEYFGASSSAV